MPGFKGLYVPGPTNMPFRVRQAMDIALEDHRAPDFPQFTLPLFADLKKIFQTKTGEVIIFPGVNHGFNADYRPSYDKLAADYAAKLAYEWFADHGV